MGIPSPKVIFLGRPLGHCPVGVRYETMHQGRSKEPSLRCYQAACNQRIAGNVDGDPAGTQVQLKSSDSISIHSVAPCTPLPSSVAALTVA